MITRRQFLKLGTSAALGALVVPNLTVRRGLLAASLAPRLSDPALQPKFVELAPNPLDPAFRFEPVSQGADAGLYNLAVRQTVQQTGLRRKGSGKRLNTTVWGYGYDDERGVSWPGRTFQVQSHEPTTVRWNNQLVDSRGRPLPHLMAMDTRAQQGPGGLKGDKLLSHLLPVDTSLHWAYSLHGYEDYSIRRNGVPIVTHLHGGHSDFQFDGNPEFFWSPNYEIIGPQWYQNGLDGIIKDFVYLNDQPAGSLWYHDHALGITRLNVYAGMAGFYFVRDAIDTGMPDNPLGLPAFPYEMAFAVQDRMFTDQGALFYPAFPGDPFWEDFITGEGLEDDEVPQPSALAEFFGDHMVVNGKVWPKVDVEPRHYRVRLLNGCDSRFLVIRFRSAPAGATDLSQAGAPLPFWVIGGDQGLASAAIQTDTLVFEPGGRYDVVFDFSQVEAGSRIILENIGGDAPFGGKYGDVLDEDDLFPDRQTDRVMAFDVLRPLDGQVADRFDPAAIAFFSGNPNPVDSVRKVALFEGLDEYGRLQPLLGAWLDGEWKAIGWHSPTTEAPSLGSTEDWEIYNFTGDAHPVHLHLVHFQVLGRSAISFDSDEGEPGQAVLQHNGTYGVAPSITNVEVGDVVPLGPSEGYVNNAPKDVVTALPEQVTRIRATFDKPGRYVWHCHILSHEDHEMMRVLEVS